VSSKRGEPRQIGSQSDRLLVKSTSDGYCIAILKSVYVISHSINEVELVLPRDSLKDDLA
jgi:hypothetical protein